MGENLLRRIYFALFFLILSTAEIAAAPPLLYGRAERESDMPLLIRALVNNTGGRVNPGSGSKGTNRQNNSMPAAGASSASYDNSWQEYVVLTKSQYVNYLKSAQSGSRSDCVDRYNKYNDFFRHDSTLSGSIGEKTGGPAAGRLDTVCEFLGYSHWCFALGFAYALRDLDDPARTNGGQRCYTYQEFCQSRNKAVDATKVDEYLSRVIDEIMLYHTSIKNTTKNTVATTTETRQGPSLITSTSWRVYDTDSWVRDQISTAEMTRLLCR